MIFEKFTKFEAICLTLCACLFAMILAAPVYADSLSVTVMWTAPTQRTDGSAFNPATELDHYVLIGPNGASAPANTATSFTETVTTNPGDTLNYTIRAVDTDGLASADATASYSYAGKPMPPGGAIISVQ